MQAKTINKNIALLEYGGSHTECMYTQIEALKEQSYNIFLICNKSLVPKFTDKSVFSEILLLNDTNKKLTNKEKIQDFLKTRRFTKKNNIHSLVINTLEFRHLKYLLTIPLPYIKNYIGIVHYSRYINTSGTFRKLYKRINKIFFLSDFLLEKMEKPSRPLMLSSFYPICYPHYSDYILEKPDNEFWLCSPGAITPHNKDISFLLDTLSENEVADNIKIILLGVPDSETKARLEAINHKNIVYFTEHIPQNAMDAYMKASDMILPLIHSNTDMYGNFRISGTYNLAYGYQKPMFVEEHLQAKMKEMEGISITYNLYNFVDKLCEVANKPEIYQKALYAIENHPYLNTKTQCKKFIELIEDFK